MLIIFVFTTALAYPTMYVTPAKSIQQIMVVFVFFCTKKLNSEIEWIPNMPDSVVTRFAPSPTGFLHIGGARTALFNWLYAKANGGKMLLRIEDTDRARSSEEAVSAIIDGLNWLGIAGDDEPISQFARADRHKEVALQMLESGHAYKCYATQEELQAMRDRAKQTGEPVVYAWREKVAGVEMEGAPYVVRLKAPNEGETILEDSVQGTVSFANRDLDDMVLLRSDLTPTYMLAVVVDDHDMGVTHIIRGDDHLTNAARQSLVYKAMNWNIPKMAHIPLIHGPDGAKLSKRHGALGVEAYREMGYLPEAILNYLVRLGWSHGDDEIISINQMIEWFDTDAIGKGASRFDFAKLENLNGHYIRHTDDAQLLKYLVDNAVHLKIEDRFNAQMPDQKRELVLKAMPLLKERAKTMIELAHSSAFLFATRPLKIEEKAANSLTPESIALLSELKPRFEALNDWNHETIGATIKSFAEEKELKLGKVAPAVRTAVTGTTASPGVFDVMELFGKEESIARIGDQL